MNTTVTFAGNLAEDPDIRFTKNGHQVANFRVIVNRRVRNAEGEWSDATPTTHRCEAWGDVVESIAESLSKGDRVIVTGELVTESYDKDGETRYTTKVRVDEVGVSLKWASVDGITRRTGGEASTAGAEDNWEAQD